MPDNLAQSYIAILDVHRIVGFFAEFHGLTVGALVVKKHPQVVDTVRKLRKYVGPKDKTPEELEKLKDEIEKVRLKADSIYVKIKSSFALTGKVIRKIVSSRSGIGSLI